MSRAGSVRRLYRTASELQGAKRIHCRGKSFSYLDLTKRAEALAGTLSPILSRYRDRGADRPRVAYCVPETFPYLVAQFSSWMSSATAVPIHPKFPAAETDHVVGDSDPSAIICTESTRPTSEIVAKSRSIPLVEISEDDGAVVGKETVSKGPPDFSHAGDEAMLIYTSGTTGKPKGVVWTHEMVDYQAETMSTAWRWNRSDRILLFLPLDHVHGIMNIAGCAVWNGAELDMMEVFDQHEAWSRIRSSSPPTVFMAVPTVYARMIQAFEQNPDQKSREAASRLRLCVSGSAALQATYFRKWEEITGQRILERYGMSEVGMALSNPYEEERREGWVGKAFPGVRTGVR
uniref:AMP-dependent synthetase/ligase domain-containing protein n=1 Tax=Rhodosorus marinus TaxID=101924 RepID=A0A7S2ZKG9_9RHOD|mmetsp:Transcript_22011/g.89357  ORF Transcript_22011/g.89357 Transcript_22011/m.89357 type:complete len:347 (+) Transcript_22011:280-1320(+)